MKENRKNLAASVHARLLNVSREQGTDFNRLLIRFAIERLLYRLSRSRHADRFVLKGAMLFVLWSDIPYRDTQDLDLLGYGDNSLEGVRESLKEICEQPVEDDGIYFDVESIEVEVIRALEEYVGSRATLRGHLGNAVIPLQIDIGVGDAVVPRPQDSTYPSLLDFPKASIKTYPVEAVIAEKFQAMVRLGMMNTRMKDYLDVYMLCRQFEFDRATLRSALDATFKVRSMEVPTSLPLGLTEEFFGNVSKVAQWNAFVRKLRLKAPPLTEIVLQIAMFLTPVLNSIAGPTSWKPPDSWS